MEKTSLIAVLGSTGLVGSNLVKALKDDYSNVLAVNRNICNFLNKNEVDDFFFHYRPEYVFDVAGKVGGINANNTEPAAFIYENLVMQTNIIDACYRSKVTKLLFTGSSCIYPKLCHQPIHEDYLLSGPLEETNIGYAIAKIAGLVMCRMYRKQYSCDFISVMPTNLYGAGDNFHLTNSHVLPAFIRRFHEAKISGAPEVEVWGSGLPKREFLYIEDLAKGLIFIMNHYSEDEPINIGTGIDVTIQELVQKVQHVVGYKGNIKWNLNYPDGTMQKLLSVDKLNNLGWKAETSLEAGLIKTYKWFVENYEIARK